jgi:hypothetical protein
MATAIMKTGSGGQQTVLTIHSGDGHASTVQLSGELPLGVWTSAATGTTAILQNGAIVLVAKSGARRRWLEVAAAAPVGQARLLLFPASSPPTIRRF